jgi:transcriptional regulator with XRE-family HTH domain
MDLVQLGKLLQERRSILGMPRAVVARRVGVSPSYIWRIEEAKPREGGGPSQPSQQLLERWAAALGWDESYVRQLLVLAGHLSPEVSHTPSLPLPFSGVAAVHYPNPKRMEQERLLKELRDLLDTAQASEATWKTVVRLIESFFDWLRFHIRKGA